jgi:hypothetical protein
MKAAATVAACTGMACASGPALMDRPPPPSEPCPPEAIAGMRELGIYDRQFGGAFDFQDLASPVRVREGRVAVYVTGDGKRMRPGTPIIGTVYVAAKRIYGRFTEAKVDGKSVPVCF